MSLPELRPDFARYLDQVNALLGPMSALPTVAERRRRLQRLAEHFNTPYPNLANVSNESVPSPGGEVPVRIFRPSTGVNLPAVVYFHGGGWVAGTLDTHDYQTAMLCSLTGAVVVSVDYRLAPEHRHPAALDDCFAALYWVAKEARRLGVDPARIAVAGDSAGGQLAVACALRARARGTPRVALQVLVYPAVDSAADTASFDIYREAPVLSAADMRGYWDAYVGAARECDDEFSSPIRADLAGLPPALVLLAEIDPLHDEGEAFARRLEAAGVAVRLHRAAGLSHGFLRGIAVSESARAALQALCADVRHALER